MSKAGQKIGIVLLMALAVAFVAMTLPPVIEQLRDTLQRRSEIDRLEDQLEAIEAQTLQVGEEPCRTEMIVSNLF